MTQDIDNNNFVGVFDNVLDLDYLQAVINYFSELNSLGLTSNRLENEQTQRHIKNDETAFLMEHTVLGIHKTNSILVPFLDSLWGCYGKYREEFSMLDDCEHHGVKAVRLQKTCPGQGYHAWHFESATSLTANRLLAFSLYLNDVVEGGETEFLYLKKRIPAKAGRLVIWPAGFTHAHRGNPPLSNEKYILTGWIEYMGVV